MKLKSLHLYFLALFLAVLFSGCEHKNSGNASTNSAPAEDQTQSDSDDENDDDGTIKDGTYSATVDYNNPNTNYSATYTLDVEVSDGEIVQIDFPNDGYLNNDHIDPAEVDDDGNASVEGEDGKTYEIHIDM